MSDFYGVIKRQGSFAAGAANGTNIVVITGASVTTGKRWRIRTAVISGSVSGRYVLAESGQTIYDGHLLANEPLSIQLPGNGLSSTGANLSLTLANNTGVAADLAGQAFYEETF